MTDATFHPQVIGVLNTCVQALLLGMQTLPQGLAKMPKLRTGYVRGVGAVLVSLIE
jgi:hypothetical protein